MRQLPFAIFNTSLSVHIRYRFWTYWLLPSIFPTWQWSFRPGVTYVISSLSKMFLSHSFSLSANSFFGLPAFDWVGFIYSLNLFANAEMTSLRFLGLFGSVFATFWRLLDLMWTCEKAESSFCSVTRFAVVAVAILSLTRCRYFFYLANLVTFLL